MRRDSVLDSQSTSYEYRFVMSGISGPTMRDVAKAAGLSQSTVSKALRNDPTIPATTREHVRTVAEGMKYRPNALVSTLMAQLHSRRPQARAPVLVALGVPGGDGRLFYSPMGKGFLSGARARASRLGYELETCLLTPDNGPSLSRQLRYRKVCGMLVLPLPPNEHEIAWDFSDYACVALGRSLYAPRLHHVSPHHSANLITLFKALRERGYKRIGLVLSRAMSEQVENGWLAGYARYLHLGEAALPPCVPQQFCAEAVVHWVREHRPDAIIVKETHLVPRWLMEAGEPEGAPAIFTPGRLGEGDYPGVNEDAEEVGAAALDLVVAQIHANTTGVPPNPRTLFIAGHLEMSGFAGSSKPP